MSVSKPFVFALVCQEIGAKRAREKLGVNATGLPFDSLAAVERSADGRTNPMVNAGAIATTSLVPGATLEAKWQFIRDGLARFAGRSLALNEGVYDSAAKTNHHTEASPGCFRVLVEISIDPAEAIELYTKQCSLNVTARISP